MNASIPEANNRLIELEKTVAALDDRVRNIQSGLWPTTERGPKRQFWRLIPPRQEGTFMSSVCNRLVRPNRKVAPHDGRST